MTLFSHIITLEQNIIPTYLRLHTVAPTSMVEGVGSALVGYGGGMEVVMVVLGGALLPLLVGGALHLSFVMCEMGHQVASSESSAQPLVMSASSTPLGVDYLIEGVAAMFLSSPWSSSEHPSWSFGSGSIWWCL
jgi:hypothetical protein